MIPIEDEAELQSLDLTTIKDQEIRNFLDYHYLSSVNPYLITVLEVRGGEEQLIQRAIARLYELDKKQGFIKQINEKYGIPIWDRYDMLTSGTGDLIPFVPLAFPYGQETTAFFAIIPRGENDPVVIVDHTDDLEQRGVYCYTHTETVCDGGDSSCMECDGGVDGGGTSGGSSGSSGDEGAWGLDHTFLPYICVSGHDLTQIGSSYYVNFSNFSYNFLHHETGITVSINFAELCLNIPDKFTPNSTASKIKYAMENTIAGVEAWLELWYQSTIPSSSEVASQFKYQLNANLNSLVTVGSSLTTSPGACQGVPLTPTRFQC